MTRDPVIVLYCSAGKKGLIKEIRSYLLERHIKPVFKVKKSPEQCFSGCEDDRCDLVVMCVDPNDHDLIENCNISIPLPVIFISEEESGIPDKLKSPVHLTISPDDIRTFYFIVSLVLYVKKQKEKKHPWPDYEFLYNALNSFKSLMIIVTQGGKLIYFNKPVKDFFHLSDEEIKKRDFLDFVYPEDRSKIITGNEKRLSGEYDGMSYQFRARNDKGEVRWFSITGIRIDWDGEPATLNFLVPVDEQKKYEEHFRRIQMFLDDIIEFSPAGIIILDRKLRVSRANRAVVEYLGMKENELQGRKIEDIRVFHDSRIVDVLHLHEDDKYNGLSGEIRIASPAGKLFDVVVQRSNYVVDHSIILWFRDITEEKIKEKDILERELKFRTILEYSPVPLYSQDFSQVKNRLKQLYKSGIRDFRTYLERSREEVTEMMRSIVTIDCNQEALRFFEISDKREFQEILPYKVHEELIHTFIDLVVSFWEGENVFERGSVSVAKSGREINGIIKWVLVPGHEIRWDMVLVAITDISERLKYEKQLKVLSSAIDHSPVSVVITDPKGVITYVNPRFTEVTGYSAEEAIGQNPRILKSGNMPDSVYRELWDTISRGKEWRGEFENKKKNGELFWELASITGIKNEKGEIAYYVAIKEDITKRKKTEMELIKAKEKAEESDRLKTAFLANMSHEIRTPLNAIIGFSDILRSGTLDPKQREEYFSVIESSSQTLLKLIDDIIDVAKIEAGNIRVIPQKFDLNELMNELYTTFRKKTELNKGQVALLLSRPFDREFMITADVLRLKQVLSNLLENAVKFTQKGNIEFGYLIREDQFLEFYVKDTGIGIPEDKQGVIFNRFRQVDDSYTREFGGTGLGLWISKSLVGLMGGEIRVVSKEGRGAAFYFTLPLGKETVIPEIPRRETEAVKEEEYGRDWSDKKILIAEDNESNFEFLRAVLSVRKAGVLRAVNGLEVLNVLRDHEDVDIVLMDIQMPELNGYEATRLIKEMYPGIPVIAQTAFAMSEDRKKALDAGCDAYLAKPIQPRKLLTLMEKLMDDSGP